jgi:hypothetical protein
VRKSLIAIALCVAAPAIAKPDAPAPAPAHASPDVKRPTDKPKPIDTKDVVDKLDVFKDDFGNYYVSPRPDAMKFEEAQAWVFYGDGKAMYQQRIVGSSVDGSHYEWNVWSPRVIGLATASIELLDGKLEVGCQSKNRRSLVQLKADEARTLIQRAKFYPPLWQRQARLLARDDDGVYYYVDELRDEFGGNGYRVFIGQKGAMKETSMTNMVSDSAGEIYATKTGQLKIIAGKDGTAFWIKGGKKVELTVLPPVDNRRLIYRDLGLYGQLGVACEDL